MTTRSPLPVYADATAWGIIGLAICFDIRFPHLLAAMIQRNPDICAYLLPSAFNCVTGPLAWEVLQRVRAIDNQIFVGMCSPARNDAHEVGVVSVDVIANEEE
jgi:omega-amidase